MRRLRFTGAAILLCSLAITAANFVGMYGQSPAGAASDRVLPGGPLKIAEMWRIAGESRSREQRLSGWCGASDQTDQRSWWQLQTPIHTVRFAADPLDVQSLATQFLQAQADHPSLMIGFGGSSLKVLPVRSTQLQFQSLVF